MLRTELGSEGTLGSELTMSWSIFSQPCPHLLPPGSEMRLAANSPHSHIASVKCFPGALVLFIHLCIS